MAVDTSTTQTLRNDANKRQAQKTPPDTWSKLSESEDEQAVGYDLYASEDQREMLGRSCHRFERLDRVDFTLLFSSV